MGKMKKCNFIYAGRRSGHVIGVVFDTTLSIGDLFV
jgi:hypothetical protein